MNPFFSCTPCRHKQPHPMLQYTFVAKMIYSHWSHAHAVTSSNSFHMVSNFEVHCRMQAQLMEAANSGANSSHTTTWLEA